MSMALGEHVYTVTFLTPEGESHSLMCACGWMSQATTDIEASSDAMVNHYLDVMDPTGVYHKLS